MMRYPVKDKNIVSVGYDEMTKILEIEFKLQVIHRYHDVYIDEFVSLMKAAVIEKYYFEFVYAKYLFEVS